MAQMKIFGMTVSNHVLILGVLGIILIITGLSIVYTHNSLRNSGLGMASLILGIILFLIGLWRFGSKQ